jgi:hypothetical protein
VENPIAFAVSQLGDESWPFPAPTLGLGRVDSSPFRLYRYSMTHSLVKPYFNSSMITKTTEYLQKKQRLGPKWIYPLRQNRQKKPFRKTSAYIILYNNVAIEGV